MNSKYKFNLDGMENKLKLWKQYIFDNEINKQYYYIICQIWTDLNTQSNWVFVPISCNLQNIKKILYAYFPTNEYIVCCNKVI